FNRVVRADGFHPYRVITCGPSRSVRSTACEITVSHGLRELESADTLVIPGMDDISKPVPQIVASAIRRAAERGGRIASICAGAFVLAATGLLEGRRATTHWMLAEELARRYPGIEVDPRVLYVDQGQVLTSAGATAGIDLCLHLIRKDFGAAVAAEAARLAVAPLERAGGQAQFIRQVPPLAPGSLQPLHQWIDRNLGNAELSIASLARRQATSVRSLHRHFVEQTGATPAKWILQRRVRRAQELLETTSLPVDAIAHTVGFSAASTFRGRFRALVGTSPVNYRRLYRADRR
ncbi:MAG: GlxA family transcriptional regulator, partial [Steroidobacteraceae bacterium]